MNNQQENAITLTLPPEADFPAAGPNGYWIRILFHGLLAGWMDNGQLHVGALNRIPDHFLKLTVHQRNGAFTQFPITESTPITLNAQGEIANQIRSLQLTIPDTAFEVGGDRTLYYGQQYRHDFRWLLDFERMHKNDHAAGQRLTKKLNRLQPQFHLNAGLLYTLVRSIPLQIERGGHQHYLGRTAQTFAVNLYGPSNASATLQAGTMQMDLPATSQWDVVLRNDCDCVSTGTGGAVDLSELNATFHAPQAGQFEYQSAVDPYSAAEQQWWQLEQTGIDFGLELSGIYPFSILKTPPDSRTDPCGEAFFG